MGLKSGSRDAGLEDETTSEESRDNPSDEQTEPDDDVGHRDETTVHQGKPSRHSASDIPYKLRREKVNEGREQVPFFLREKVITAEDDLQAELEERLSEDVYKSDYREAAMIVAQKHPELVAEVLREWGYDLQSTTHE